MTTYLVDFWKRVYIVEEFNFATIVELTWSVFIDTFMKTQKTDKRNTIWWMLDIRCLLGHGMIIIVVRHGETSEQ